MSPEFTKLLLNRFPQIYSRYHLPECESLMCRGFQFEDGWYDIILELSEEIELSTRIDKFICPQIDEIKQKFGTLRIRLLNYDPAMDNGRINNAIIRAQEKAMNTCEKCGEVGELFYESKYLQVLCSKHNVIASKKLDSNIEPVWKKFRGGENG